MASNYFTKAEQADAKALRFGMRVVRELRVWDASKAEHALFGGRPVWDLDDAWPERIPMPEAPAAPSQTLALVRELGRLRQAHPARPRGTRFRPATTPTAAPPPPRASGSRSAG